MLNLTVQTWRNFAIWMAAGMLFYLVYGRQNSVVAQQLHRHRANHHHHD
jgi:APA family basic amino acid/polyamine antiporter